MIIVFLGCPDRLTIFRSDIANTSSKCNDNIEMIKSISFDMSLLTDTEYLKNLRQELNIKITEIDQLIGTRGKQ